MRASPVEHAPGGTHEFSGVRHQFVADGRIRKRAGDGVIERPIAGDDAERRAALHAHFQAGIFRLGDRGDAKQASGVAQVAFDGGRPAVEFFGDLGGRASQSFGSAILRKQRCRAQPAAAFRER